MLTEANNCRVANNRHDAADDIARKRQLPHARGESYGSFAYPSFHRRATRAVVVAVGAAAAPTEGYTCLG